MPTPVDPFATIEKLTQAVDRIDERCPKAKRQISKVRTLILQLDCEIEEGFRRAIRKGLVQPRGPKVAKAVTGYSIAKSRQGIALSERRSTGAADFRCPRRAYDAVAAAIETGKATQKFDAIHKAVARSLGEEVPIYWVRVATRYFVKMGLLTHARAQFEPVSKKGFAKDARAAWEKLESTTK
jgi:hypothetical protein